MWATAAAVFLWIVIAIAALGGIAFGLFLWAEGALYVGAPVVALTALSFAIAHRIIRREGSGRAGSVGA